MCPILSLYGDPPYLSNWCPTISICHIRNQLPFLFHFRLCLGCTAISGLNNVFCCFWTGTFKENGPCEPITESHFLFVWRFYLTTHYPQSWYYFVNDQQKRCTVVILNTIFVYTSITLYHHHPHLKLLLLRLIFQCTCNIDNFKRSTD